MKKILICFVIVYISVMAAPQRVSARVDMDNFVIEIPNGVRLNVIGYSAVEQFVVNANNVEFTMPERSSVTLESTDGYYLENNHGSHVVCGLDRSSVTISVGTGEPTAVVRVTPSNPKCSFNGGGAGNWLTEGGGNTTPIPGAGAPGSVGIGGPSGSAGEVLGISTGPFDESNNLSNQQITTQVAVIPRATTTLPFYVRVSPIIRRNLSIGSTGEDVKRLQALLNADPETRVATSGPGAPGRETGTFFSATRNALLRFQSKWGLSALGYLDSVTRARLPAMFINIATTSVPQTIATKGPTTTPVVTPPTPAKWWQFWRWFR